MVINNGKFYRLAILSEWLPKIEYVLVAIIRLLLKIDRSNY